MTELSPLSERVDAPSELQPSPVSGLTWRPATLDDLDAVIGLYAEMAAVDHPDWAETREEVEDEFTHSWVDLALDTLIGEVDTPAGRIVVAHGQVLAPPEPETIVRSLLFGGVHPQYRGRGIGRSLLEWQEGRGRQQLAASGLALPGWLMVYAPERNARLIALAERFGFRTERWFSQLSRDLSDPIPELALPDGLQLVTMTPDLSEQARLAKNDAFRDHWGSQPNTREQWDAMLALPTQRPDLSFLALHDGTVVGLVLVEVNEADWSRQGSRGSYIPTVAVVGGWRRRGVAPALLAAALRAARDAGLQKTVLDVDSENPTGALGLYAGMGFVSVDVTLSQVRAF